MSTSNPLELPSLQRLQSAEQNELLDVIDSLRSQGMGDFISLPQLIVCGDQSSGKSSVLEAISGIPFPRQETLCTRFATEVILRRKPTAKITASIVPQKGRTPDELSTLKDFQHELKSQEDFESLFKRAGDAMGFSASGKSFSKDILRVEICGPSHPQLTLVDLPGLIHTATKNQSLEDVPLVHGLVEQYLKSPRSIILAVVSAKNDIGNQIILEQARKFDSGGRRTLGIITKPDTLMGGSKNEEAFISLARNEDVSFDLGWHVVRNIDSADPSNHADSRDVQETRYFETSNFNRLPSHTVGIAFLRARLSKVLFNQIRTELPKLVQEIEIKIGSTKEVYEKFGPSRAEAGKQRDFLISLSQSFQTICRDAVRGTYEHEFFQGVDPERRLCAEIMNKHFEFANTIRKYGATWIITEKKILAKSSRTREEAIKEACVLLKRSRGRELPGLPNPSLVGELFRIYSKPWRSLAQTHIKEIWETTNKFLELLLRHLTDEDSCEKIQQYWLFPKMEEKLNLAHDKLNDLLAVHEDQPITTNAKFLRDSKARQSKQVDKKILEKIKNGEFEDADDEEIAQALSSSTMTEETDMDMIAAEEAFDNMNAFYKVAVTLFMDNVPTLAVNLPIIRGLPDIFCPTAVLSMDIKKIQQIAGESEEKVWERNAIERKLKVLEDGGRICRQYARRVKTYPAPVVEDRVELDIHPSATSKASPSSSGNSKSPPKPTASSSTPVFKTSVLQGPRPTTSLFGNIDKSGSSSDTTTTSPPVRTSGLFGRTTETSNTPSTTSSWSSTSSTGLFGKPVDVSGTVLPPASFGNKPSSLFSQHTSESARKVSSGGLFNTSSSTASNQAGTKPVFGGYGFAGTAHLDVSGISQAKSRPSSPHSGAFTFGSPAKEAPKTETRSPFQPNASEPALGNFSKQPTSTTSTQSPNDSNHVKGETHHSPRLRLIPPPSAFESTFSHTIIKDPSSLSINYFDRFYHICFLENCKNFSPEELRLAHRDCLQPLQEVPGNRS